jgi:hypothetical protein
LAFLEQRRRVDRRPAPATFLLDEFLELRTVRVHSLACVRCSAISMTALGREPGNRFVLVHATNAVARVTSAAARPAGAVFEIISLPVTPLSSAARDPRHPAAGRAGDEHGLRDEEQDHASANEPRPAGAGASPTCRALLRADAIAETGGLGSIGAARNGPDP